MKKRFFYVVLICMVILSQIANILEGATYRWDVIILIFGSCFALTIVFAVINTVKLNKITEQLKQKNYEYVINAKETIVKNEKTINYLYYLKALAYMELGRFEEFKRYLDKIFGKEFLLTKLYLLFVYYALIEDKEQMLIIKQQYSECHIEKTFFNKKMDAKKRYDKVIYLIEQDESLSEEENAFVESLQIEQIKKLIKKKR